MGQWLSAPMLIIGAALIVRALTRGKTPPPAPARKVPPPPNKNRGKKKGAA
jgi:hypothetical protein